MVLHDYLVQAEVDCDPSLESCFVWECDTEEDECTGNPDEDTWYYKIAYRNAKNIPACNTEDETCEPFVCPEEGEAECSEVLCTSESLEEFHVDTACTVPEDFATISTDEEAAEDGSSEEAIEPEDENSLPLDEVSGEPTN